MVNGMVQVPPCGPVVAGGALYFSDDGGSQLALTQEIDLSGVRFVALLLSIRFKLLLFRVISFYLQLEPCSSTATIAATISLEYKVESDSSFTILQTYVESG